MSAEEFEQLFICHARAVHRFCARRTGNLDLAEDLTSIVFLEAWRHRERFHLSQDDALPWLLGVAANVTRNVTRSRRRYSKAMARLPRPSEEPDHAEAVADRAFASAGLERARSALNDLTPKELEVFVLVGWENLTYEQTAAALEIPIGTVRSRLSRARHRLRDSLHTLHELDPEAT